jgi:hypothetical protein
MPCDQHREMQMIAPASPSSRSAEHLTLHHGVADLHVERDGWPSATAPMPWSMITQLPKMPEPARVDTMPLFAATTGTLAVTADRNRDGLRSTSCPGRMRAVVGERAS